ncbi:MAG: hypothetical protein ACI8QZ_002760, partial [Chlamydiales bacterium]
GARSILAPYSRTLIVSDGEAGVRVLEYSF